MLHGTYRQIFTDTAKVHDFMAGHKVIQGSMAELALWKLGRRLRVTWSTMRRLVIQNEIGIFEVGYDDTLDKSNPRYEANQHDWLRFDNDGTFIDIGANVGLYTLLALRRYGYTSAYCYEPNPVVADTLERNIHLNGVSSVCVLRRVALSSRSGTGRLLVPPNDVGRASVSPDGGVPIALTRFDDDFSGRAEDIRFVKIDVEGHELEVVRGMRQTLEQTSRIRLLIEIWHRNPAYAETVSLLRELGFSLIDRDRANHLMLKH